MQIGWHIICSNERASYIQNCLKGFPGGQILETAPYWKEPGLSMITCECSDAHVVVKELEEMVRQISGVEKIEISRQGECVEYSAYVSIEKVMSSDKYAFVVCFVNMKENVS